MITTEGRVVILDFGLTADLESSTQQTRERQIVGTVGHMSPEQAGGLPTTAASDWYSVGVILFEIVDREAALRGHCRRGARRQENSPGTHFIVDCFRTPGRSVAALRAVVESGPRQTAFGTGDHCDFIRSAGRAERGPLCQPAPVSDRTISTSPGPPRQFASLNLGRTESVFVVGRTGTGKSTLVRSFLDELIEKDEAVVLTGRCCRARIGSLQGPRQPDRFAGTLLERPAVSASRASLAQGRGVSRTTLSGTSKRQRGCRRATHRDRDTRSTGIQTACVCGPGRAARANKHDERIGPRHRRSAMGRL